MLGLEAGEPVENGITTTDIWGFRLTVLLLV